MGTRIKAHWQLSAMLIIFAISLSALQPLLAQSVGVLIVGDVSGSLQGFVNEAPRQIEILYRVLRSNAINPRLATMSDRVQFLSHSNIGIFSSAMNYRGQTTALAAAIKQATSDYSSVIIVTDGMESDNLYLNLQEALAPLVQKDWGIWIMLLPMPFAGRYDLEQPIDPQHYRRMLDCVREKNPIWKVEQPARKTVYFEGERPLLLFVFDKNVEQGRDLVLRLVNEITNELRRPEVVELSPLYLRGYTIETIKPQQSLGVRVDDQKSGSKRIVADPNDGGPSKQLLIHLDWQCPACAIVQPFEEKWLLTRTKKAIWGDVHIAKGVDTTKSPGALMLKVNAKPTIVESVRCFFSQKPILRDEVLQICISSTLQKPIEGWWREWHSETTWEYPHKVFKLTTLIEKISGLARDRRMKEPPQETLTLELQIGLD
ncbi:VWA domain-containing protein [Candidatus Poribacteria bacterium]|nr:VWA domain-containing protein [Candidatus Poribacteria bacterium]